MLLFGPGGSTRQLHQENIFKEALRKYFECDVMSEANFTLLNYGIRIYLLAQPNVKHRKVFFCYSNYMFYFIYVLESEIDNKWHIGYTTDPPRRLKEYNSSKNTSKKGKKS